jgi:hypothetical protein
MRLLCPGWVCETVLDVMEDAVAWPERDALPTPAGRVS